MGTYQIKLSLSMRLLLFSTPFFPPKAILTEIVLTIAGQIVHGFGLFKSQFQIFMDLRWFFTFEVVEICLSLTE